MKKTLFVVGIVVPMLLLSACGSSAKSEKASDGVTESIKEVSEEPTGDSVDEKDAEMTEEVTTGLEVETKKTESALDSAVSSITGDWFVDGNKELAFIHIKPDATFRAYHPGGILECEGTIRYEEEEIEGNVIHWYHLYNQNGEFYMGFVDDGSSTKTDLYVGNGGEPHYVKVEADKNLSDGQSAGEEFVGEWGCGRASLEIKKISDTEFHAMIIWSDSAVSHAEWDYPLTYQDGKLVCDGKCTLTYVEFKEPATDSVEKVEYTDGSAEFEMQGVGIIWNDLTDNSADDMVFLNLQS